MTETLYFNHAGTSWPKPDSVWAACESALRSPPDQWPERFSRERASVCKAMGIADPAGLLLTPGCTSALALAISDHPWSAGDRVVTSSMEHHALYRPLVKLDERGVKRIKIPRAGEEAFDLSCFEQVVRERPPRLVALTAASNVTGECLPIPEIARICQAENVPLLIDGAQVVGWPIFDLVGLGIDLFTFAGHKGPRATWGIGGLYVAPQVTMHCLEARCEITPGTPPRGSRPGFCDAGSVDLVALASLAAGWNYLQKAPADDLLDAARERAVEFREALCGTPGIRLLGGDPRKNLPTVAIELPHIASEAAARILRERGIHASGGWQCAPEAHQALGTDRAGLLRFSFAESNSPDQVQEAVAAVFQLARKR